MEAFYGQGIDLITEINRRGHSIFLDLKCHDIPNTVKSAMRQLAKLGVDMVNVYASGGVAMMKAAIESRKPIFTICRGMQVLNVACGGTIYQDLEALGSVINHMQTSQLRKDISHKVLFTEKTKLHHYLGDFAYTNSFHHQAVDQLGKDLIVSGRAGDDIIEAIEMPSHPFVIGVQWHPECMCNSSSNMRLLFHAFIHYTK